MRGLASLLMYAHAGQAFTETTEYTMTKRSNSSYFCSLVFFEMQNVFIQLQLRHANDDIMKDHT